MSRVEWSVVTSLKVELSGVTSFKRKKMFYQNWTDNPMFKWKVVLLWEWYVVVNIKFLQPLSEAVGPEVLPPKWGGTNSSADICLGGQVIPFVCDTFLHMSRSLLIWNNCVFCLEKSIFPEGRLRVGFLSMWYHSPIILRGWYHSSIILRGSRFAIGVPPGAKFLRVSFERWPQFTVPLSIILHRVLGCNFSWHILYVDQFPQDKMVKM